MTGSVAAIRSRSSPASRWKSPQRRLPSIAATASSTVGSFFSWNASIRSGTKCALGRDRELRVRVEHHPQQRRARTRDADDEGRGEPGRVGIDRLGRARRGLAQSADSPDGATGTIRGAGQRRLQLAGLAARDRDLVAELAEQVAGNGLERLEVGGVHPLAPAPDRVGRGRLLGQRVRLHPLFARPHRLAVHRLQVVRHLRHPLLGALVVGEHPLLEGKVDELADRPQGDLGVEDQVLVPELEVMLELSSRALGAADPALPVAGDPRHRGRVLQRALDPRHRDVAPIADQVDESGLRKDGLDLAHLVDVVRCLVTPARLALLLGVELVEGAHHRLDIEGLDRLEPGAELLGIEVEVRPTAVLGEPLERHLRRHRHRLEHLDQIGKEVRLGRDRELRMRVEHQPQHRRAGAADADDERGGCHLVAHEPA